MSAKSDVTEILSHPVFREALADMQALGVQVSTRATRGAKPYALIGGRSNARWWLIPLESGPQAASGLALFQPLLRSARYMKAVAGALSRLRLHRLWATKRVFLSGDPGLGAFFPGMKTSSFAYFTGTDSPHRKLAVQVMDGSGAIKGFAKLSRSSEVAVLLSHEAGVLDKLQRVDLKTGHIPNVLFAGRHRGCSLLVTDTLKSPQTVTTTQLTRAHQAFLQELASKTAEADWLTASELAARFRTRFARILPRMDAEWQRRLDAAITTLEVHASARLPSSLSQGDFTPWNSFLVDGKLYVFDWEYAEARQTSANDLIHFVLSQPGVRPLPASARLLAVRQVLAQSWTGIPADAASTLLVSYLLTQSLRQLERLSRTGPLLQDWDGKAETAEMFDLLSRGT